MLIDPIKLIYHKIWKLSIIILYITRSVEKQNISIKFPREKPPHPTIYIPNPLPKNIGNC